MCIARSYTMDALKPCSAIVDLPSNEWVMNKQEQAALLAYVSVKRHSIDRDPKLSKSKKFQTALVKRCHLRQQHRLAQVADYRQIWDRVE